MIDQLNIKLDSSYENKLLAERYPSLYEYMLTKKEDIGKL